MADPVDPWAATAPVPTPTPTPAPDRSPIVQAWDVKQNKVVPVTANELQAGSAAGTLRPYGNQQVLTGEGATIQPYSEGSTATTALASGEKQNLGVDLTNEKALEARRQHFHSGTEFARQVFLGIVDAGSMGLIHPTGEREQIAAEENSGARFIGNAVAFAVPGEGEVKGAEAAIEGGSALIKTAKAVKSVAPLGIAERGIGAITRAIPEGTTLLGKAASGAVREGINNAVIGGLYSVGEQTTDALFSDHKFSGEEAVNQIKMAGFLGSAFGGAAALLKGAVKGQAGIKALEDQQGLVNVKSDMSQAAHGQINNAIDAMDNAVNLHANSLKIAEGLDKNGDLMGTNLDFKAHKKALNEALEAQAEVKKYSVDNFTNPVNGDKQAIKAIEALEDYQKKFSQLDNIMKTSDQQLADNFVPGGQEQFRFPAKKLETSVPRQAEGPMAPEGLNAPPGREGYKLDAEMTPEKRAQFQELQGRPWEPMEGTNPYTLPKPEPKPSINGESPVPLADLQKSLRKMGYPEAEVAGLSANEAWAKLNNANVKSPGADALAAVEKPNEMGQGFGKSGGPIRQSQGIPDQALGVAPPNREVYDFLKALHSRDPQPLPGDVAATKIEGYLAKLSEVSQGQITAANAMGAASRLGIKAETPLGRSAAALYGLRQLARESIESARGAKPGWFAKKAAGLIGADVMGHGLGMGPVGSVLGFSMGQSANLAGAVGKARRAIIAAGDKILGKGHASVIAKTIATAAYSYDGSEPTTDLKKRLQQLHYAVNDEVGTRGKIQNSLGDLSHFSPSTSKSAEDTVINQQKNLSARAPAYVMFGTRELAPTVQAQRQFENYEAATHDREGLLNRIASGRATPTDYLALNEQHPETARILLEHLIKNVQDSNGKITAPVWVLRTIEKISGGSVSLTRASDPGFVARQQANAQTKPVQAGNKPQALSSVSASAPLQTQLGTNGRAPGN